MGITNLQDNSNGNNYIFYIKNYVLLIGRY